PAPDGAEQRCEPEEGCVGAAEEDAEGEEGGAEEDAGGEVDGGAPAGRVVAVRRGGAHPRSPTVAGPGTVWRMPATTVSGRRSAAQAPGVSVRRWASTGTATRLTSSGRTTSRPSSTATPRARRARFWEPRGDAPTSRSRWVRVAAARSTQ